MWLAIAITSYFINSGVYIADKFLLSKKIHSSITYAFYVGIWSIFNIVFLIKYIYLNQPFIGAFVWSRFGTFIGALLILFIPGWRKPIIEHRKDVKTPKNLAFFLSIRILAALAFIMINLAISLGNVALVNSLQGVQYAFLILLVLFLSAKHPDILEEELGGGVLLQKIIGVSLVSIGLYMLIV